MGSCMHMTNRMTTILAQLASSPKRRKANSLFPKEAYVPTQRSTYGHSRRELSPRSHAQLWLLTDAENLRLFQSYQPYDIPNPTNAPAAGPGKLANKYSKAALRVKSSTDHAEQKTVKSRRKRRHIEKDKHHTTGGEKSQQGISDRSPLASTVP